MPFCSFFRVPQPLSVKSDGHEELRGDREIVLTAVERCGLDVLEQPVLFTLKPKTLNPKTLNPKTLNPKTLNPKP